MPSSLQELQRLANGVSLIANEFIKRPQSLSSSDIQTLISSPLRKATDIFGFPKGSIHPVSTKPPPKSPNEESVVYFTSTSSSSSSIANEFDQSSNSRQNPIDDKDEISIPVNTAVAVDEPSVVSNENLEVKEDRQSEADTNAATVASAPVPGKRRLPRERRVPSTPFTRALGFAGLGAGLAWGTLQESTKRLVYGTPETKGNQSALSPLLSEQNAERLHCVECAEQLSSWARC